LRIILTKLTEFEQRLGSVEGINTQLRGENRRLRKKNSNLRRVASVVSASQRLSSDMLARALKLVDELETDRRRLIEEIK
jgi:hypothetical protein